MQAAARIRQSPETAIELASPKMGTVTQPLALLLDRVIFFGLLALIMVLAIPYGSVEAWWESIFECVIFVFTALWIVEGLLSGLWRFNNIRLVAPLLALVVFAYLQSRYWQGATTTAGVESYAWTAISADPYETRRFVYKLLALILTGVLLQSHITNRRRLNALIGVLIFAGVASAIFGVVRQTAQHEEGFLLAYLRPEEGYAQFINRNHFAYLMEMTFGLALGLILGGGARRDRALIYVAAIIPLWTALVLSNSRAGIGSLLGQVLFMALMIGVVRRTSEEDYAEGFLARLSRIGQSLFVRFAIVSCLIALMIVGIIWMGGDPLASRMEDLATDMRAASPDDRTSQSRVEIWMATWRLIKAHPVLGSGFGAYGVALPEHHDSSGELIPREAHNDYLELLANGGIIAGLIGLWFAVVFIKRVREQFHHADAFRRAVCFGAVIGIFGVALHSLADFGLHITFNAIVFTALVTIATLDWSTVETAAPDEKFA